PSGAALSFLSNHDNQQGHGYGGEKVLTFFDARLYKMATAFLLAWPYGLPRITSSYRWQRNVVDGKDINDWVGPPADSDWNMRPVVRNPDGSNASVPAKHDNSPRWPEISNLVELRKVSGDAPVTRWWDNGGHAIAFGRRGRAFVVINNEDHPVVNLFETDLPPGVYCDVLSWLEARVPMAARGECNLVVTEKQGRVLLVGINRPEKRNCVDSETACQLVQAFRDFDADDSVNVAVLHGKGGTFCAGYDLSELSEAADDSPLDEDSWPMGPSAMLTRKPTVAAVNGYAVAGGLELALWCDLRVVDETAVMGVFCRRFGVPLLDGGTVRLPALIGLSRALDLILTGRPVSAKEALDIGLANRVVSCGT
ncbi:hypothetical protein HPB47_012208, partial [Ixodes persulcatus]